MRLFLPSSDCCRTSPLSTKHSVILKWMCWTCWRGAIPVQPGLMVEDFGLKAFEPLGGESLGPMRLQILREGPGRSELKNNSQIRNRSEHMSTTLAPYHTTTLLHHHTTTLLDYYALHDGTTTVLHNHTTTHDSATLLNDHTITLLRHYTIAVPHG